VFSSVNGLNAHSHPAWLQLYLSVCKLLDLALCLPADRLPQFQMYSWAFVGRPNWDNDKEFTSEENEKDSISDFVPHVVRLVNHMAKKDLSCEKLPHHPGRPLLTMRQIGTLTDLQSFFLTVSNLGGGTGSRAPVPAQEVLREVQGSPTHATNTDSNIDSNLYIQRLLELDFLECLPN